METTRAARAHGPRGIRGPLAAVLAPIVVFYAGLLSQSRNLPLLDDYDAGLDFANQLILRHTFRERLLLYAAARHSEYKLLLGHAFLWLQLALTGHLDFRVFSLLGNASPLLLAAVLWKMFLPATGLRRRLTLFLPVTLLLFQYGYVETLNWPLPGLQTLPVVAFAVAALYLLHQAGPRAFAAAVAAMILGIAASGNGFLIAFAGAAMLLLRRRWAALALWIAPAAAMAALYAFRYHAPLHPGAATKPSAHALLLHPHILYLLGFLGAAGRYLSPAAAVLLGAALCLYLALAIRRGLLRQQPVLGFCLLFLLLTGLGVAALRGEDGLLQSMSSRYRIYSDLLLVFAWFALVRHLRLAARPSLRTSPSYLSALALSALFCLAMDAIGARTLVLRDRDLVHGITLYERSGGTLTPMYAKDPHRTPPAVYAEHARQVLRESERLGIYHPPIF